MSGLFLLILIFIGVPLLWRWFRPYFFRWAQHRTEDYVRRQMGMPPRDRSQSRSQQRHSYSSSGGRSSGSASGRRRNGGYRSGPLIPKEYAVDVEYTEIRSYSSEETIASDGKNIRYSVESQVSDAEIIEIRKDR
ncbi:MAG: hypothetical protein K2N09_08770 [Muribaculaceae bacterium]|nr:hypothetical protein [Muribaculaceae bacterium]